MAAGFAYGLYFINTTPPLTYLLNVSANGSNDTVSLVVYQSSVDVSYSSVDSVRILLNRLTPVLYNPSLANTSETYDKNYNVNIQGIRVPIHLRMNAVYDEVGVMRYGSGEMYTRVVNIDMYGNAVIGDAISIDFVLDSMRLNTVPFLSIGGVLALGITIYSVLSLRRADEIAMVTGEAPSLPYY